MNALARINLLTICVLMAGSCAPPSMRSGDPSTPVSDLQGALRAGEHEADFEDRIQTKTIDRITVSACILPDEEARRLYGANLAKKGVQAVWLRVSNKTSDENWLLASHMDPDYYTSNEAAYLFRRVWSGAGNEKLQQHFRDLAMRARLEPGKTYEGHILIPRSEGGRFVEVITNGNGRVRRFGFPLRTPDGHFDFEKIDPSKSQSDQMPVNLSRYQLRARLEHLPPVATNEEGDAPGDPLNIVLVGESSQMMAALSECGWSFTHRIDWTTIRREIGAALRGKPYLTAPVSALHVFGRPQDLSFQRSRMTLSQRNHMRLWRTPYSVEGKTVWVGQVSRDIGIKLTRNSPFLTTHVIDPMVDEARQFVLESLLYRFRIESFGFVRAMEPAPRESPRHNLGGDPYITDGMRLVVFIAPEPVRAEDVRNLGWGKTGKGPIEYGQSGGARAAGR